MVMPLPDENSAIGSHNAAWLGRLITRVESSVDKLADRIEGLETAIASDMKDMREGFRRQVSDVEARVNLVETRLAQVDMVNKILAAIGGAMLVGFVTMGMPRIWGQQQGPTQSQPAQTR